MAFTNEGAFSFHLCHEEFDLKAVSECQRQPALMSVKANYLNMKTKTFANVVHVNMYLLLTRHCVTSEASVIYLARSEREIKDG